MGCIMFECLVGRAPFKLNDEEDIVSIASGHSCGVKLIVRWTCGSKSSRTTGRIHSPTCRKRWQSTVTLGSMEQLMNCWKR